VGHRGGVEERLRVVEVEPVELQHVAVGGADQGGEVVGRVEPGRERGDGEGRGVDGPLERRHPGRVRREARGGLVEVELELGGVPVVELVEQLPERRHRVDPRRRDRDPDDEPRARGRRQVDALDPGLPARPRHLGGEPPRRVEGGGALGHRAVDRPCPLLLPHVHALRQRPAGRLFGAGGAGQEVQEYGVSARWVHGALVHAVQC
jgi:hypothetical protein